MEFRNLLEDEEFEGIELDQDAADFSVGDLVRVTFIAEVSGFDSRTQEYEVILPYNFLQGRYNHASFHKDDVEFYKEPFEEGAIYKDTISGDIYYRFDGHWLSFGSNEKYTDDVFGWTEPVKIIDSNGDFV